MGNKASRAVLKERDLKRFCDASRFEVDEVRALYGQFLSLKGVDSGEDLTMNLGEFQAALGYKGTERSIFIERTFKLFDTNHDGLITFEEFLVGLSLLTPTAPVDKKTKFTFAIYDLESKGRITPENLRFMLSEALKENAVPLSSAQVEKMVADTFKVHDVNRDGVIDFDEYQTMCAKLPALLKPLTLNIPEMIQHAKEDAAAAAAHHGGGGAGGAASSK